MAGHEARTGGKYRVWAAALQRAGLAGRGEVHGGAVSRALALYLAPDSVVEVEFGQQVPEHLLAYADNSTWDRIIPDGSWGRFAFGDADIATAESGRTLLEHFVTHQGRGL